jgi:hypothetical protein
MKLEQIKDPKLVARIEDALRAAGNLRKELSTVCPKPGKLIRNNTKPPPETAWSILENLKPKMITVSRNYLQNQSILFAKNKKDELKNCCSLQSPQPEPPVQNEPLAEDEGKKECSPRIIVRVKCFRQLLCDPDNLCPKSLIDGLRYSGLIPDDRPQDIELIITQEKCPKKDERTEIELVLP